MLGMGHLSRAWKGMAQETAMSLVQACTVRGIDIYRYGQDLPRMAVEESEKNIWAVRWLYHHLAQGGLCLRPPYSMVDHIGFDEQATNATSAGVWADEPLRPCPPLPEQWPPVIEDPVCPKLWQNIYGASPTRQYDARNSNQMLKKVFLAAAPPVFVDTIRNARMTGWRHTTVIL